MLYELTHDKKMKKIKKKNFRSIQWIEEDLEHLLANNINDFISNRALMPIFRQRPRQEEPDILALDSEGNLYIFELKRGGCKTENLLQVLRYGQIFGNSDFKKLNQLYFKYRNNNSNFDPFDEENIGIDQNTNLQLEHQKYFDLKEPIEIKNFNKLQNFIVVTNGIDQQSLEAIEYWKEQGIKIDALIYWVYKLEDKNYLEISKYMPNGNLLDYETHNYVLNTNLNNNKESHNEILEKKIAAAYYSGWKEKIDRLQIGDRIFLYQSRKGIIASGIVNSE